MRSTFFALAAATAAGSASAAVGAYGQCGGQGWSGETACVSGYTCQKSNDWYSQCLQGTAAAASTKAAVSTKAATKQAAKPTSTQAAAKSTAVKTTSTKAAVAQTTAAAAQTSPATVNKASSGGVQYAGVNIAGLDFGCGTDGTCNTGGVVNPGQTGLDQMKHFATDAGLNTFRIPVGWQYLVDNNLGGTLNSANWATYDAQIQGCLDAGAALCIIDLHNYGRWNGAIVGQGGPTDVQFASVWSQIASKYKSNAKIAFGLMNEPHDVNIDTWATSVQAAVTAIRKAGATSNKILLPGNEWTHASAFISNGSGAALLKVKNLDGSTTDLIFDVHQYLDSDGSGTSTTCTTNNVDAFTTLGAWLRTNKRQAILTETGGSDDASCLTALCEQFDALNKYSDAYLGWTGWSAGMFDTSYALSEVPSKNGNSWSDKQILTKCVAGKFNQ